MMANFCCIFTPPNVLWNWCYYCGCVIKEFFSTFGINCVWFLFVHFCNYEYLSLLGFLAKKSLSSWEKSLNKIQFTDSWFVFRDSSWSFHEPYFSRKRIFHEWYRVNVTQDYGLKTCKKCHNLKHILINDFQHHPFLYWIKVL